MTADPEIVAMLISIADLMTYPHLTHHDGTPAAPREVELVGQAGLAEVEAASRILAAEADFYRTQDADMARFTGLVDSVPDWATVGEALRMLSPADRAEAEQIMDRLFPDGYFYPGLDRS